MGRTRTCTYFRNGKAYKVCRKRGGRKTRCHSVGRKRSRVLLNPHATTAGKLGSGWHKPFPAIVRIWKNARGHCSGTLITRGILLTAAHCLYINDRIAREEGLPVGHLQNIATLEITPGSTWIEGVVGDELSALHAPYRVWRIVKSSVPQGWANGDGAYDYAFAEVEPQNGRYPGDFTGVWKAYVNAPTPKGTRFWNAGYPMSDAFQFSTNHYGLGQYHCDNTWDGDYIDARIPGAGAFVGSGYYLAVACEMTGGSSGGPVFQRFSNGSWGITGVNNIGNRADPNTGLSTVEAWQWFGNNFRAFYCSVLPCSRSVRAAAAPSAPTRVFMPR